MTIVFARGTTERGNVGTIVGPPFLEAVRQASNGMNVNMQGVEYPADIRGFMRGGDAGGSSRMYVHFQATLPKIRTLPTDS